MIECHNDSRLEVHAAASLTKTGSDRDVIPATHSQYASTKEHEWTVPDLGVASAAERGDNFGVHVQVERTDCQSGYETEISNLQRPLATWTSHRTSSWATDDL